MTDKKKADPQASPHACEVMELLSRKTSGKVTVRGKLRVIEAREAESPGASFLDGIDFIPRLPA